MKLPVPVTYGGPRAGAYRAGPRAAAPRAGLVPAAYDMTWGQWARVTSCLESAGFAFDCKAGRSDCFIYDKADPNGLTSNHIHVFDQLDHNAETLTFTNLLTKSSSFRSGNEPDLAGIPMHQWAGAVSGMNAFTRRSVAALAQCLNANGAAFS